MRRPRAVGTDRPFVRGVVLLTLALLGVLTLWATLTPPFSTVDEQRHLNSVVRLAQGGGWPAPKTAPMLEASAVARAEALAGVPHDERSGVLDVRGPADRASIDWMTQHPPLYYGIAAGVVVTGDALVPGEQRWDTTVLLARLVSVVMTAAALPFVASSLRRVTRSDAAALVGASTFLLLPQLFNSHSLVTNDSMVTLVGSVLVWACLRAYLEPRTLLSSSVVGGVALGVGLLTKGLLLPAVAVLAVFLLLAGRRAGRGWGPRFWTPLLGGAIAFAIGGWWWVRNLLVHGQLQSSLDQTPRAEVPFDEYSPLGFVVGVVAQLNRTFWGSLRPALAYPTWVSLGAGLLAVLVVGAALVLSRRRGVLLLTLLYPALVASVFTFNASRIFWNTGIVAGVQGRYLYSGLTFLALALALVWQELVVRRRRVATLLAGGVAVGAVLVVLLSWAQAFRVLWQPGAAGTTGAYRAMVGATPLPVWLHLLLAVGTLLLVLAAAGHVVRTARREASSAPGGDAPRPAGPATPVASRPGVRSGP